jgi:hypothetical protein
MLRYEAGSKSNVSGAVADDTITRYTMHVYIDPGGAQPDGGASRQGLILLALFGAHEKPRALEFARNVAGLLGAEVQDRCFENGEISAAGVVVDRLGPEDAD